MYSVVNRGDLVRADLDRISLPQVQEKIFAADVGGTVSDFLNDWERTMLRDPPPSDAEVLAVGSYGDATSMGRFWFVSAFFCGKQACCEAAQN